MLPEKSLEGRPAIIIGGGTGIGQPHGVADATLTYLAKRESLSVILTIGHADFATYRIEGKKKFRVLPLNRPRPC
jgi:hypothetical protein